MATTTKKGSKNTKAKPRRAVVKTSPAKKAQTNAELRLALAQSLQREDATAKELREALEHQTATAEVLGIISRSPTDVQPVLDAIVESAARVCGIDDLVLRLREGDAWFRAHFGSLPIPIARGEISVHEPQHRWMRDHGTLHVPDTRSQDDFPRLGSISGWRTFLGVPLRQQGEFIGGLFGRRTEVRPFTPAQIKLLETFADQAVIAIENVRLFKELKESLEQQTATSEILGVIASSPTDIQPVLDVVAENAAKLCDANDALIYRIDGDYLHVVASFGPMPTPPEARVISRRFPSGRAISDRQTIHIHDRVAEIGTEYPDSTRTGVRTILVTPLLREEVVIGCITIRRTEVRPFSEKQIALLKTFAAQAVIAIENVRLFQELQARNRDLSEALDQQTATGEVLRVIASSPTVLQPVLDTVIANAVRLIGAEHGHIRQYDGEFLQLVAYYNVSAEGAAAFQETPVRPGRETGPGRAFLERKLIHIPDVEQDPTFELPPVRLRTFLAVPMLREGIPIGTISIWRETVAPFTERQIELVTTFADQAVIAIENTRLFQELKESLEQQTATSEILGVIASSPTDVQPVLDAVAASAARLCDSVDAQIFRVEGDVLRIAASYGALPKTTPEETRPINRGSVNGRAVVDRRTIHVHDLAAESETEWPEGVAFQRRFGHRTILATPLLREGTPIGAINIRRWEVRPFSDKQIKLLETFADQAVIAIENVRLFQELEARTRELSQSVGELRALGEVGQAVSSTLDLQTVLSTIVRHAIQLSRTDGGVVYEYDEAAEEFHLRASHLMDTFCYERQTGGSMEVGSYAHRPIFHYADEIPSIKESRLSPTELPFTAEDFDQQLEEALELMPDILSTAEMKYTINGLLSLTPDGFPLLGETTEVRNLWSAAAVWIKEGPGVGRMIAEWMTNGAPEIDPHHSDITRFYRYARTDHHVRARARSTTTRPTASCTHASSGSRSAMSAVRRITRARKRSVPCTSRPAGGNGRTGTRATRPLSSTTASSRVRTSGTRAGGRRS